MRAVAEAVISAPAERAYRAIADFRGEHSKFLPPPLLPLIGAFSRFQVEEGGVGAGTIVSFRMTVGGRSRDYRSAVAEPEPGRILTESDLNSSAVTTFTVTPEQGDDHCRVRIETTWQGARGIGGFFERLFAPRVLRRLYANELGRLEAYLQQESAS